MNLLFLSFAGDYLPLVSPQLTFGGSAGEGSVECLNMTLINDEVAEVDEDFTVIVEPVSDFVTTASPSSATFTIDDDDCETYTVSLLHLNQCLFLFPETVAVVGLQHDSYTMVGADLCTPACQTTICTSHRPCCGIWLYQTIGRWSI